MFTLSATPVQFVVLLVLFVGSLVWELVALIRAEGWTARTSSAAHLLMAIVMVVMVPRSWWMPFHKALPLPALIILMALGLAWFVWRTIRSTPGHRSHPIVCSAMFATMVWHLWAMQVKMSHAMVAALPQHMDHQHMDHSGMSGMHHHGPAMTPSAWQVEAARPGHLLWWFAVIGVVFVLAMVWVSIRDLVVAVREPQQRWPRLAEAAMCFGMAWMSIGLLEPVAPWLHHLSF